jgi:hypothetical protein
VANTLWAIARLSAAASAATAATAADAAAADAANALASRITKQWIAEHKFEPQHVANIAWACAKLGLGSGGSGGSTLAAALGAAAATWAPRMNTQAGPSHRILSCSV